MQKTSKKPDKTFKKTQEQVKNPVSEKKEKIRKERPNQHKGPSGPLCWSMSVFALLLWSAGLSFISLQLAAADYGQPLLQSYFENGLILFLNVAPVFLVVFVFFLLTNRVWGAMLSSGLLIGGLSLINYFKLLLRNDPLLISDFRLAKEAANIGQNYNIVLEPRMLYCILGGLCIVLLSMKLFRARFSGRYGMHCRLALGFVAVVCGIVLHHDYYASTEVYEQTENLEVHLEHRDISRWSATDQFVSRGFMYPLLRSGYEITEKKPDGYHKKEVATALAAYGDSDIPEDKKVHMISIMLEAYNDLSSFHDFQFQTDPYEFWNKLQEESVSGKLVTNIFAGGTISTERGYITGMTENYEFRAKTDSYAQYFKSQGYLTEFAHPGLEWFYNRMNVCSYLGFEQAYFMENRFPPEKEDWPVNDDVFLPELITLFEDAVQKKQPYFNFSVTYQNHGPYSDEMLYSDVEYVGTTGFSQRSYKIINNYLSGVAATNKQLEEFFDYFRTSDEPVVIVLFGDHNPWLGDNNSVYLELGMDIDLSTEQGFYNYYSTPYIIWANDKAKQVLDKEFVGDGGDMSPCFLMSEVFAQAGWEGNAFLKANQELRKTFDIVHSNGMRRENGSLVEVVSDENRPLLLQYKSFQYYLKNDRFLEKKEG